MFTAVVFLPRYGCGIAHDSIEIKRRISSFTMPISEGLRTHGRAITS